ncbi:MAG: hypothetical protein L3K10_00805 [Thermoplasmata archaeon]|nr:hypothetical protein [Thermoplasmata archaeon]
MGDDGRVFTGLATILGTGLIGLSVLMGVDSHAGFSSGGTGVATFSWLEALALILVILGAGAFLLSEGLARYIRVHVVAGRVGSGSLVAPSLINPRLLVFGMSLFFLGFGLVLIGVYMPLPAFFFTHGSGPATVPESTRALATLVTAAGAIILGFGLGLIGALEARRRKSLANLSQT